MSSQLPAWLTFAVGVLGILFGVYNARIGPRTTRQTDIEKGYLEIIKIKTAELKELQERCDRLEELLESERDECRDKVQELRDSCNIEKDALRQRLTEMQLQVVINSGYKTELDRANEMVLVLEKRLRLINPRDRDDDTTIT